MGVARFWLLIFFENFEDYEKKLLSWEREKKPVVQKRLEIFLEFTLQ